MLRMAYEKEVILSIRHRIEMYEQEQIFCDNITDGSDNTAATFEDSHIHLGSCQRSLNVLTYERVLERELQFHGFGDSLAGFLRDYTCVEVYGSNFEGDGFHEIVQDIQRISLDRVLCIRGGHDDTRAVFGTL